MGKNDSDSQKCSIQFDALATMNLDDDSLTSLYYEIEAIVDSKPITKTSNDPADIDVIAPNHLLLLRGGHLSFDVSHPPDIYYRRH